jgi:hypothetical protein
MHEYYPSPRLKKEYSYTYAPPLHLSGKLQDECNDTDSINVRNSITLKDLS